MDCVYVLTETEPEMYLDRPGVLIHRSFSNMQDSFVTLICDELQSVYNADCSSLDDEDVFDMIDRIVSENGGEFTCEIDPCNHSFARLNFGGGVWKKWDIVSKEINA